jgi:anti-sigma regulatory factor (Ser/Thr protein kinase)
MAEHVRHLQVSPRLAEHDVWEEFARPLLADLPQNVARICEYGFTEMLNNVIDHSESRTADVVITREADAVQIAVSDEGVGIFNKIRRAFDLPDDRTAVLELAKGKLTTDPKRHTGEGVFFTARMFDEFRLSSGNILVSSKADGPDWLLEDEDQLLGTFVKMSIRPDSKRTTKEVFDRFAGDKSSFDFDTTVLAIRLARSNGEDLVSRSQAKRILSRLEQFKRVILDFEGIAWVGPAFADEIFRVFTAAHPEIDLVALNASPDIQKMINRARSSAARPQTPGAESNSE